MIMVVVVLSLPSDLLAADEVEKDNVGTRAISWVASALVDNVISKPLGIIGDIVKFGGAVATGRYRILTFEKNEQGFHFALIDIDPRTKEQRREDNAESAFTDE